MTIRIDRKTKNRLEKLAKAMARTKSYVAAEAIRRDADDHAGHDEDVAANRRARGNDRPRMNDPRPAPRLDVQAVDDVATLSKRLRAARNGEHLGFGPFLEGFPGKDSIALAA